MCGIFGIVLNKTENAKKTGICDLLINGLLQLQNRGYDSAGLCFIQDAQFDFCSRFYTHRFAIATS